MFSDGRVLQVRPGVTSDFRIPPNTQTVQFSTPLGEDDYHAVSSALSERPDVLLRIYDGVHDEEHFRDLDFLMKFSQVRRLSIDLWFLRNLDGLAAVRDLGEFIFGRTKTKSHSLRFLMRYPSLERICLEGHTKDIDAITRLPKLERLTLRSITLPDLDLLTALPGLRELEIKLGGTRDLSALARLSALTYLELWLIKGLSDVSVVAALSSLERLFLQALKNVTALPSLRSLDKLRSVHLETMKGLTDISPIADAPALESLHLVDMSRLEVETLKRFAGHPTLRHFHGGLGSMKRNAQAEGLVGLPQSAFY